MSSLLAITPKSERHYGLAIILGIISGIVSGMVKSGTEGIFPPRTPGREAPPLQMIHDLGINTQHMTYVFSEQIVNWGGAAVHYVFSIVVAIVYCYLAEIFPKIKLWQGVAFAIVVAISFHGIVLPLLNLSPAPWALPRDEIFSEFFGTIVWMWVIEIVRRDLRNRITGKPDPKPEYY